MTDDEQFNMQLQAIMELVYGWFCERGLPLDIQETMIGQVAEQVGYTKNDIAAVIREAAHRSLLQHTSDYEVTPMLAEYERRNPNDEKVRRNLEIRDLLHEKINGARRAGTDVIAESDVYDDPEFSAYDRKLTLHNVEYLSKTERGIELAGQDGFFNSAVVSLL